MSIGSSTITQRRDGCSERLIVDKNLSAKDNDGGRLGLLKWTELAEWQQADSSYIRTGYRVATPSVRRCLQSWFYLHNESVNIISHLIGAVLFLLLPFHLFDELNPVHSSASLGDVIVFALYLFGVATCLVLSALFHTLMSHSPRGVCVGLQLDFQGIILLVWSATAPMVYYTFYREPGLRKFYWSLNSCFAVLASIITFTPTFHKPATKPLRAGVFGGLALSTLTAIIHGVVVHGWDAQSRRFPLWAVGLALLFNTLGALVYVLHFPERQWPQKFDIFGASHQLMHLSIVIASLWWVVGMVMAFDHAHSESEKF